MSPFVDNGKTYKIYDVFDKQDFVATLNNPYNKEAPRCNFSDFIDKLPKLPRTLDLGGGMGMFSKYLKATYDGWDVTHSDFTIKRDIDLESLDIKTRALNFIEEPIGKECYDLITAWEVLEHIPYEKLEMTLKNIYDALPHGGIFMFSTPDFDSPLCKSNDFFAICPPFHYLVFSKSWLEVYFEDSEWEIHSIRYCSDFLDDADMWYD
jgi:2-polyprenyl-3-methyl-5-hydroxy-6-metoxy-1,4-benzoquinol methylase